MWKLFFLFLLFSNLSLAAPSDKNVIKNLDGSVTILQPRVVKGNQKLKISSKDSKDNLNLQAPNVCTLFGFENALSFIGKNLKPVSHEPKGVYTDVAVLDGYGHVSDIIHSQKEFIDSVTCYNEDEFRTIFRKDKLLENPDGSFTIYLPKIIVGHKSYVFDSVIKVCQGFGFTTMLDFRKTTWIDFDSKKERKRFKSGYFDFSSHSHAKNFKVRKPKHHIEETEFLEYITCYKRGRLKRAGAAGENNTTCYIEGEESNKSFDVQE